MNQDAAFTATWGVAVADGVGGGPSGDLASATLIHRLVAGRPIGLTTEVLAERLRLANWDLRARVDHDDSLRGMATTFTGLLIGADGRLLLAHSGDSRAYLLRDGVLRRETRDDSFVQELVDRGVVAPDEAHRHPQRNVILASFGGDERDAAAIATLTPQMGDRWLLCSDGLTDYVSDEAVATALSAAAPAAAVDRLTGLALEADTRDNVTVVVCDVVPGTAGSEGAAFHGAAADRFAEQLDSA